jgi:hypothetical protein
MVAEAVLPRLALLTALADWRDLRGDQFASHSGEGVDRRLDERIVPPCQGAAPCVDLITRPANREAVANQIALCPPTPDPMLAILSARWIAPTEIPDAVGVLGKQAVTPALALADP